MSDQASLAQQITALTSNTSHDKAQALAAILSILVSKSGEDFAEIMQELAGKELRTEASLISFGQETQVGDVRIHDVAQGDIVKLSLNSSSSTAYHKKSYHSSSAIGSSVNVHSSGSGQIKGVKIDASTKVDTSTRITNILRGQPAFLYALLFLSIVGLISLIGLVTQTITIGRIFTPSQIVQVGQQSIASQSEVSNTVATESNPSQAILGQWEGTGMFEGQVIKFNEDSTINIPGETEKGKFQIVDGKIEIIYPFERTIISGDLTIEDNNMTINNATLIGSQVMSIPFVRFQRRIK